MRKVVHGLMELCWRCSGAGIGAELFGRQVVGVRLTSAHERVGCGLGLGETVVYGRLGDRRQMFDAENGVAILVDLC